MREILFRGKKELTGTWVEGDIRFWCSGGVSIFKDDYTYALHHVNPNTVGQYTGLTDKNGAKIFEGDVVKAVLPPTDSRAGFEWPVAAVVYQNCVFGFVDRHGGITPLSGYASSVQFEVIGNVHDNPELMEVDHE